MVLILNKNDLRVQKTVAGIRQALFELLATKPLEKITITELAQRAQIQRKTFYLHYQSLDDVLAAFEDELSVEVQQMMVTMQPFSVAAFIAGLNELFLKNYPYYEQILTQRRNVVLSVNAKNTLKWVLLSNLTANNPQLNAHELATAAEFIAAGIVNAYSNWLMQPEKWTLTELIDDLVRLVNPIFDRLLATTD